MRSGAAPRESTPPGGVAALVLSLVVVEVAWVVLLGAIALELLLRLKN
jgi:hypothetical protein